MDLIMLQNATTWKELSRENNLKFVVLNYYVSA